MRNLLAVVALLFAAMPARAGTPYFQHAVLTPSSIQGELFTGVLKTNAGVSQETAVPLYYHNEAPDAPWYKPSWALLACGYSAGGGRAFANCGPVLDAGPQVTSGIEWLASAANPAFGAATKTFLTCTAAATACGQLSVGAMANGTFVENGVLVRTWHEFGAHPIGYFLGPKILFK